MSFSARTASAGEAKPGGVNHRTEAPIIGTGVHCLTILGDPQGQFFYRTEADRPHRFSLGRSFGNTRLGVLHAPRGIFLIDPASNALRGIAGFHDNKIQTLPFGALWGSRIDDEGRRHQIRDPLEYIRGLSVPIQTEAGKTSFRVNVRPDDREFLDGRIRRRFREGKQYRHYIELCFHIPNGKFVEALAVTTDAQTGTDYQTNKVEGFPVRWPPVMVFAEELESKKRPSSVAAAAAAAARRAADGGGEPSGEKKEAATGAGNAPGGAGGLDAPGPTVQARSGAMGGSAEPIELGAGSGGGNGEAAEDAPNRARLKPRAAPQPGQRAREGFGFGGRTERQDFTQKNFRGGVAGSGASGSTGASQSSARGAEDGSAPRPGGARIPDIDVSDKDKFVFRPQRPVQKAAEEKAKRPMWDSDVQLPKSSSYRLRPESQYSDPLGRKLPADYGRGAQKEASPDEARTARGESSGGDRPEPARAELRAKPAPKVQSLPVTERMPIAEMLGIVRGEADAERQWKMIESNLMMGRPERTYALIANFAESIRENTVGWAPARLRVAFSGQAGSILIGIMDRWHANQVLAVADENSESAKILQWLREREVDRLLHLEIEGELEKAEEARRALNIDRNADPQAIRKVWRTLLSFLNADHGRRDERAIHRRKDEIAKYLQSARDLLLRIGI